VTYITWTIIPKFLDRVHIIHVPTWFYVLKILNIIKI
jgi:hypothetical protein